MALKIVWTPRAEKGLKKTVDYLEEEWTEKEILNLEKKIRSIIGLIQKSPKMFPATGKHKNLRKGLIDKNNYIIYRIRPKKELIEIIYFRGTRQKPIK